MCLTAEAAPLARGNLASAKGSAPDEPSSRARWIEGSNSHATRVLGTLRRGEHVFGLTFGQFGLTALLRAVLLQTGPAVVDLWCWSIAKDDAVLLGTMRKQGLIRSIRVIFDRSFPMRQVTRARYVVDAIGEANCFCTNTHAKVTLIRAGDWRVVIETSMNPNVSRRIEHFRVMDDAPCFGAWLALTDRLCAGIRPGFDLLGPQFHSAFQREKQRASASSRAAPKSFVL